MVFVPELTLDAATIFAIYHRNRQVESAGSAVRDREMSRKKRIFL